MVGPKAKRLAADFLRGHFAVSRRRSARALGLHWSTAIYKLKPKSDAPVVERMHELVKEHRRFGVPRIHYLLKREGVI